jgi:hypothetical protein
MGMSACCTYKSTSLLSSSKSDVAANSEAITTDYSVPMEICQDDSSTPISESHTDLHVSFCPGCKIQSFDSLPDVGSTSSDVPASSVVAQTCDSSLHPANFITEYRETCSVPCFPQDLRASETGELNLWSQDRATHSAHSLSDISLISKTPQKKLKTQIPRKLRFSFSRKSCSRKCYSKSSKSSSTQDSTCPAEFAPLSSTDISQPQSRVFLSDQILMKSCEKQLDTKEEQSVTALVLATVNTFSITLFCCLCCKFHKHKSYVFKSCIIPWLEVNVSCLFK